MGPLGERLLTATDDIDLSVLPAGFHSARTHIRAGIAQGRAAGLQDAALAAALFSETLPRLINLYGPGWVATMLARISQEIGSGQAPNCRQQ